MMCSTPSKRHANGVTAVMQQLEMAGSADAALYLHPAESGAASVASLLAAVLTDIYLCNVCSCQEILRRNGRG
eukprot:COSAG01_NODE_13832_length_1529_cov_1.267133_1_plen_73_part_00